MRISRRWGYIRTLRLRYRDKSWWGEHSIFSDFFFAYGDFLVLFVWAKESEEWRCFNLRSYFTFDLFRIYSRYENNSLSTRAQSNLSR